MSGYNRYAYVMNNPLRFTDPSGYELEGSFWDWFFRRHKKTQVVQKGKIRWVSERPTRNGEYVYGGGGIGFNGVMSNPYFFSNVHGGGGGYGGGGSAGSEININRIKALIGISQPDLRFKPWHPTQRYSGIRWYNSRGEWVVPFRNENRPLLFGCVPDEEVNHYKYWERYIKYDDSQNPRITFGKISQSNGLRVYEIPFLPRLEKEEDKNSDPERIYFELYSTDYGWILYSIPGVVTIPEGEGPIDFKPLYFNNMFDNLPHHE